ncbi:MAG: hypothetical protein ACPHL6_07225, partial [Rubripirellula sp.]
MSLQNYKNKDRSSREPTAPFSHEKDETSVWKLVQSLKSIKTNVPSAIDKSICQPHFPATLIKAVNFAVS